MVPCVMTKMEQGQVLSMIPIYLSQQVNPRTLIPTFSIYFTATLPLLQEKHQVSNMEDITSRRQSYEDLDAIHTS